ncbi:PKS-NRPS hybrid synthetase CHGG_01239-like [Papaver somniferum]|uniref:PKS-NRPS hybrid synthetase CHGG_01239-like n=1 Tax=Papaver somniferum TaxID=3469 RepID=UPI000E6FB0F9|nr:PKS-NRPS hybrid synthetase CHGG_01239-like [Papaver somniferum]
MTRARMPPRKILSKLKADDKNNKTTLQQIYNARSTLRRKDLQGRLVMQQLLWLAQKKNYAFQEKLDEFGHVMHLFIAHPECVKLALCFPQVLILDCTYKTNKYEMILMNVVGHTSTKSPFTVAFCFLHDELKESYVWALQQVKLIFQEDALPKVMVTDQDAALMFAIRKVFPNAQNFLCTFHVWNDVRKKCQRIIQPLKLKELEVIAKLPDGEREVKKKKFKKAYEDNERMWSCFSNDWDALQWSITEEVYEENAAKLIANWGMKYPEIIIYLRKQFLDTNKHRFVSAFKNHHKHFDNQATSMVESAHYLLKRNLFGCVDTFVMVFDAMEDYFMSDVIRTKTLFKKSLMMKHDDYPDDKWLRGLTHTVSHLCLELIMKEVDLMDKMDANSQEECVCKMRESMGLPCRHDLLRYKDCMVSFEDIDPHWKQLSCDFMPDEDDVEIWDTPYGKRYPSGVKYHDAEYEEEKKAIEKLDKIDEVKLSNKCGRPSKDKGETSNKEVKNSGPLCPPPLQGDVKLKGKMFPSQQMETTKSTPVPEQKEKKTIYADGKMKGPKRDSLGKYLRPTNMIYKNYLLNLPEAIHEYIISMEDVEGDGNYGFHVIAEQLRPFKDGNHPVKQGDEVNYIRQRLLQTLRRNKDFYKSMMRGGGDHRVAQEFISFERRLHGDIVITSDNWMQMPICGVLIAETFNCVVHSFARSGSCFTYAPPTKPGMRILKIEDLLLHLFKAAIISVSSLDPVAQYLHCFFYPFGLFFKKITRRIGMQITLQR